MSNKYLSYEGLVVYDSLIKDWTLSKIKAIDIPGGTVSGYYHEGVFYEDAEHTSEIIGEASMLYIDVEHDNRLYRYNGSEYEAVSDSDLSAHLGKTTVACGGITKGTDLSGMTLSQVLEALLAPYVAPSGLSLSATKSPSKVYYEYGEPCSITKLTASWVNGSTNIAKVSISGDATAETVPSAGSSSASFTVDNISLSSSKSFTVKLDIDGHDSITKSVSVSNTYAYPIYYGSSSVVASELDAETIQSATKLVSSGSQKLSFTTNDSYPMIATTKKITKVTDSSGVTDYTNAFVGSETEITLSSTNPVWGPQKFYVYTGSRATLSAFTFSFTF